MSIYGHCETNLVVLTPFQIYAILCVLLSGRSYSVHMVDSYSGCVQIHLHKISPKGTGKQLRIFMINIETINSLQIKPFFETTFKDVENNQTLSRKLLLILNFALLVNRSEIDVGLIKSCFGYYVRLGGLKALNHIM